MLMACGSFWPYSPGITTSANSLETLSSSTNESIWRVPLLCKHSYFTISYKSGT